ncbi:MAG TPA: hypothetical protein VFK59_09115 [Actinomycetota bacterium]|nr:hypothetical protein [Actinomycetota bacterium]
MRRARLLPSCGLALAISLVGIADVAVAQTGSAPPPRIEIRPAGSEAWAEEAAGEQQPGLGSTFFLRITNDGAAAASFTVSGDPGRGAFAVRYLHGGAGDERITGDVVDGTFVLEDLGPGSSRMLRLQVRVARGAPIDVTAAWDVKVAAATDPTSTDSATAAVRTVTKAFGRAAGVTLRVPAEDATITFHESLFGSAAALRPVGTLLRNANPRFDPPPDGPGPGYVVMDSRGRSTHPTSGSDDVVDADEPILAPVSGTVIRVTSYHLYCQWADIRIAIRPDDAPERTVQIFHVISPRVRRGDHVVVSHTVLGRARLFPFRSQTQEYGLDGRHVHLEIERDGSAPLPGCGGTAVP